MKRLMTRYALACVLVFGTGSAAFAADLGTDAGTNVQNQASVDYTVGGINQNDVNSNVDDFEVDRKVDLVVATAQGDYTDVSPGEQDAVLTFTVQNKTNDTIDILLSHSLQGTDPRGGTENYDATGIQIFVEDGTSVGYQAAEDTATFIDDIAEDDTVTVYIIGDTDINRVDGDISSHNLIATAADSGTSTAFVEVLVAEGAAGNQQATVDNVFADAAGDTGEEIARDGKHSDDESYRVRTAVIAVVKSSRVISDPVNGTNNPKRIPGAVIEYCIVATNSGSTAASSVVVTDDFSTEPTTQVADSVLLDSASCAASDGTSQTDATGDDDSEIVAEVLTANKASVAGSGGTFRVQFRVTVD